MSIGVDLAQSNGPVNVLINGTAPGTKGADGLGVVSALVDTKGALVFTLSDKSTLSVPLDVVVKFAANQAALTIGTSYDNIEQSVLASAKSAMAADASKQASDDNASLSARNAVLSQSAASQAVPLLTAAQNTVSGVTQTANSVSVLLTAALAGNAPLTYRGYWNAATNAPALTSATGIEGDLYIVSVAGATALDGNDAWEAQDGAWYHNGAWQYCARAGWPAFAREIVAQRALRAGNLTLTDGDTPLELLDSAGFLVARVGADGSFASDDTPSPAFGLTPTGVYGGSVKITDDGQNDAVLVDKHGFPIRLSAACVPDLPVERTVTERSPGALDDVQAYFAAGDLWQRDGDCWTCLYPNAGRAVWNSALDTAVLPGDQFAASLAAAYGTSRLVSAYAGPLLDVVAVNGSSATVVTVGQDADGLLSQVDLRSAAGLSGSVLSVVRLYDQSGGGHHADAPGYAGTTASLSAVTLSNCPHVGVRRHGKFDLVSWAAEPAAAQPLVIPASLSLSGSASSVLFYGALSSCNCPKYTTYSALGLGSAAGQSLTFTVGGGVESGRIALSDYDPTVILGTSSVSLNVEHGLRAATLWGSDNLTMHAPFDGVAPQVVSVSGLSSKTLLGGTIGASPQRNGNSCAMQLSGLVLLNQAADDNSLTQAYANAAALYDYHPQARTRIDCFGSSTTQGYLNKDGWCWTQMLHDSLAAPTEIRSISVAGSTAADFLEYTIANVLADAVATPRRRMAITWYGNNDVNGGQSVATVIANNSKIHQQLRAAGYERLFILGQYNAALNAAVRQAVADGVIDADGFIDPWSAPPLSNHSDGALYHDGTHPTPAADRLAASVIAHTLNQFL